MEEINVVYLTPVSWISITIMSNLFIIQSGGYRLRSRRLNTFAPLTGSMRSFPISLARLSSMPHIPNSGSKIASTLILSTLLSISRRCLLFLVTAVWLQKIPIFLSCKRSKSICSRISRPVYTWLKKERSGTLTMDEYSYPLSLALG